MLAPEDVDAELAQQEALLADVDSAAAAGVEPLADDEAGGAEGSMHARSDDDADADAMEDVDATHPRRRRGGARAADASATDGQPERHPIAGARKIIRRTLEPDGTCAAAGIDPLDPEELKRREARAEKFGLTEATALSKKREERMKKFGMDAPEPDAPSPPPPKPKPTIALVSQVPFARAFARLALAALPVATPSA